MVGVSGTMGRYVADKGPCMALFAQHWADIESRDGASHMLRVRKATRKERRRRTRAVVVVVGFVGGFGCYLLWVWLESR